MQDEELLAEVEDLLSTTPQLSAFEEPESEVLRWLGRTAAVLREWNPIRSSAATVQINLLLGSSFLQEPAYLQLRTLLFEAEHDLRVKTVGPQSTAIPAKKPFVYFDEIRKIIEQAREDLLFVDPYLDAEFVSRYLPQIKGGVMVRLLTSNKKLSSLVPAVEIFLAQTTLQVQVRSVSSGLHDRYVFVDKKRCYQSGVSFKDGARKSPTALIQIMDIFEKIFQAYEDVWDGAEARFA